MSLWKPVLFILNNIRKARSRLSPMAIPEPQCSRFDRCIHAH